MAYFKGFTGSTRWTGGNRRRLDLPPRPVTVFRKERRQFLGYVGRFAKYAIVADVVTRGISRIGGFPELYAQTETIVERPSGTYALTDFVSQAGTGSNPRRYRPQSGAVCNIIPGGAYDKRAHTILDGSTGANRRILIQMTDAQIRGFLGIYDSNVTVQNVHFVGPHPIHYGYAWDGTKYCDEGAATAYGPDGTPQGACISSIYGTNVVVRDCVMTGVKNLDDGVRGGVRYERLFAYYMESAGGLTGTGQYLEYDQSVLWHLPNHGMSANVATGGRVEVRNSIFGTTQEVTGVGAFGSIGCDEFTWIHNTIYVCGGYYPNWGENNNHCGHTSGLVLSGPDGQVRRRTTIKNNIFRMVRTEAIEWRAPSGNLDNGVNDTVDYNLYYLSDPQNAARIEFNGLHLSPEQWLAANGGRDTHSIWNVSPLFVNAPPDFQQPQPAPGTAGNLWGTRLDVSRESVDSFRQRLALQTGSPGKNAADDGLDMGIAQGALWPPKSPTNVRIVT
jgi:hypothetical protein